MNSKYAQWLNRKHEHNEERTGKSLKMELIMQKNALEVKYSLDKMNDRLHTVKKGSEK